MTHRRRHRQCLVVTALVPILNYSAVVTSRGYFRSTTAILPIIVWFGTGLPIKATQILGLFLVVFRVAFILLLDHVVFYAEPDLFHPRFTAVGRATRMLFC